MFKPTQGETLPNPNMASLAKEQADTTTITPRRQCRWAQQGSVTHQPQRLKFMVQKSTVKAHVKLITVTDWKTRTLMQ